MGPITSSAAIPTTRSEMHGMLSGRRPPLLFGIHTRRRGLGAYCPEVSSSRSSSSHRSLPWASIWAKLTRSTPGRPRVGAAAFVGVLQDVLAADLVPEGVEAEGR